MKTQNVFKKYQISGKAPIINLAILFLFGICIMLLLGFLYSSLITIIPIIYFNVFVLFGFSYIIAHICHYLNVTFKIRNKIASMIITAILALIATYFQWVFYLYIISSENITPFNDASYIMDLLLDTGYVIDFIIDLNKVGAWEIGSVTYSGTTLWLFWLGEVILTLGISLKVYYGFDLKPFSEKDNQWYDISKINTDFEFIHIKKNFLEDFYKNPVEALNSLKKGNGTRQSNVYIFSSKSQNTFLISIENSVVNNKGRKESFEVLEPCFLDRTHLREIKENYKVA